ncbi:MAG: lysostaphin resistance A-like protein [Actinomycetota bacterium]
MGAGISNSDDLGITPPPSEGPVASPPRTAWTALDVVLVFVGGLVLAVIVGTVLFPLLEWLDLTDTTIETIFTFGTYAALAATGVAIVLRRRNVRTDEVGLKTVPAGTLWLMIPIGFGVMIVNGFIILVIREIFGDVATVEDQLSVRNETLDGVEITLLFITTALAAPIVEEFLFRGILYRYLRGVWGILPATLGSAALFSVLHLIPSLFAPLFFLGVVLAFVVERYDSIYPGIVLHGVINVTAVTLLIAGPS